MSLVIGLITGILFGILLQRSEVLRFDRQIGALRLKDMTILKFMLSAIVVGSVGIYLFMDLGLIQLKIKATAVGAQMIGGALFGIGWAILGYCPGTAGGALGEGRTDAAWGILGMLAGGALHAWAYPVIRNHIESIGTLGKLTLPQLLTINHWAIIPLFAILVFNLFRIFEKNEL